ncbi:hypothetical protein ACLI4Y_14300 [Natrialbaceae archaeon A-CW3]
MSRACTRVRLRAVFGLVALLVLLSGCSAFGGADDSDREPYGIDEPTSPESEVLPELTATAVTDVEALLETHDETLADRSYRLNRTTERFSQANESTVRTASVTVLADGQGSVAFRYTHDGVVTGGNETVVSEKWGTEEGVFVRDERWHEQQYELTSRSAHDFTAIDTFETGLAAMDEFTVTTTQIDGVTRYVLESESERYAYHNGSVRVVVHEAGYVESYRFEYERMAGTERETVVTEVTVDRVGDPAIALEPPAWLPEAKAAVGEETDHADNV